MPGEPRPQAKWSFEMTLESQVLNEGGESVLVLSLDEERVLLEDVQLICSQYLCSWYICTACRKSCCSRIGLQLLALQVQIQFVSSLSHKDGSPCSTAVFILRSPKQ